MSSLPLTTEAYVAHGNGTTPKLSKITYPSLQPHELLVEILAVSICHTDMRAAAGTFHMKPPLIPGHEGAGYVKEIGKAVEYVKVGDAVILGFAWCGECRRCLSGKNAYCDRLLEMNFTGTGERLEGGKVKGLFFGQSSMARVALVHESCCVRVPGEMEIEREELKLCASLGCGVQTGAGAILYVFLLYGDCADESRNVAKPSPGDSIAIFGAGTVGLSALLAAKLLSPSLIILVDNSASKLAGLPSGLLKDVHTIDSSVHSSPDETAAAIRALTPESRGVDFAFDCVGNTEVILTAHTALDKLGTLINVGSSATATPGFSIATHLVRGIAMRGTHQGDSVGRLMVPYLISLWKDGKFPFDQLLTEYKFEELEKALEDLKQGRIVKGLLVV